MASGRGKYRMRTKVTKNEKPMWTVSRNRKVQRDVVGKVEEEDRKETCTGKKIKYKKKLIVKFLTGIKINIYSRAIIIMKGNMINQ